MRASGESVIDFAIRTVQESLTEEEKLVLEDERNPVSPNVVRMNDDEVAVAHCVAERRNSLNFGDKNFPGEPAQRLIQHKAAALAEMAVAKHYNVYWTGCGKGTEGRGDVGGKWEVRSILSPRHGLIVREDDPERPHILVFVAEPLCTLIGWARPKEVRRQEFFHENSPQGDTPFWLMPQSALTTIGES